MAKVAAKPKLVNGDDIIYRLFLFLAADASEDDLQLPSAVLRSMAIWVQIDAYQQLPVLMPFVVRDPDCRANPKLARPDRWGAPDQLGYMRDDNSMVKGITKALSIRSTTHAVFNGARMGSGFVAAHIWRETADDGPLASRRPLLNTFVPNLVWLPRQIAKLTDREGGPYQRALQSLSWGIYRDVEVEGTVQDVAEEAWGLLPEPAWQGDPIDLSRLNWFSDTNRLLETRRRSLRRVKRALSVLAAGGDLDFAVGSSRYREGLPAVTPERRAALASFLSRFPTGDTSVSS